MKNIETIILLTTLSCFCGQMHINFGDGTPTGDINFDEIDIIKIIVPSMVFVVAHSRWEIILTIIALIFVHFLSRVFTTQCGNLTH
jgi:hypothetical protein